MYISSHRSNTLIHISLCRCEFLHPQQDPQWAVTRSRRMDNFSVCAPRMHISPSALKEKQGVHKITPAGYSIEPHMLKKEPARAEGQSSSSSQARTAAGLPNSATSLPEAAGRSSLLIVFVVSGLPVCNHVVSTISKGTNSQLLGGGGAEKKQAYWVFYFHPEV